MFIISTLCISGQYQPFKTRIKNPAGTIKPDFSYIDIDHRNSSKSEEESKIPLIQDFQTFRQVTDEKVLSKIIRKNGIPIFIERKNDPSKSSQNSTPEGKFYLFIEETRSVSGLNTRDNSFKISDVITDDLGITHIKAIQQYKGVDIYGSESTLHIDAVKERFTGSFNNVNKEVKVLPSISSATAVGKVIDDIKNITVYKEMTAREKVILHYDSPSNSLVLYNIGNQDYRLTWAVTIRPNFIEEWKYFIDAANGEIIMKFNNTCSDGPATATAYDLNNILRSISTYMESNTYYLIDMSQKMYNPTTDEGIILTLDANNTSTTNLDYKYVTSSDNTWSLKSAVSAHYNAIRTYTYFFNTFGRNSLNGKGGNIISLVNVAEEGGSSMENAFWNGQAVFYGNGGPNLKSLAGALDVTAHELGHGVVSNTANLDYNGQSGAINESFADVFGSMVDREDWLIGEDITKTSFSPSGALRNMADPNNMGSSGNSYWQPKNLSEMYLGTNDNGGVHINSGIGNYVYYLYATAVTKDKAEKVYYRALSNYLTKTSQFIDLRIAIIQSATDLYGADSQEVIKAGDAFSAAGISDEAPVDKTRDYNTNPGQEYLMSYYTDNSDLATLYKSSVTGTDLVSISNTIMKSKVSVTDDGSFAVFVSDDNKIRDINLSTQQETVLSNQTIWDNVAISKDGKRLAAISTSVDTSIYVYDFNSKKWAKFKLYNPTTSQFNTDAGGVLYADALEFDVTGENLIYDACNVLSSSTSADINYWDIGFINVWKNSSNAFGTGSVSKLFGSLPQDVSIGNPVFSKNSPSIIAFDYINSKAKEYAVYGADLNSGEVDIITSNSTLGYPSFSKNDQKLSFSALNTSNVEVVAAINLAQNKISGSGSASILINYAKWPVYYATGNRVLGLAPISDFTADIKSGDSPLQVKFIDLTVNEPTSWQWTFEGGTPATSTLQYPGVTYNNAGTFGVALTSHNSFGNNTITRELYITISNSTGINDSRLENTWFYPNPVHDILNINCDYNFSVKVSDLNGSILLIDKNNKQIDISGIKPGLYVIEITTENGLLRQKMIKK